MANIQDIKSFKEELHNQTEKVEIPRLSVDKALLVINSEIKNTQDAFLYFASLNLLNAYVKNHRKEIIAALKLQWKENNPTSSEFKNVRGSIDDSIKEIVTKINKKNYFSKEGVWVKMSKIPYIN